MAHAEALKQLALSYERQSGRATFNDLYVLAGNFIKARNASILDAAAIGFAFDVIFSEPTFDISKITPEMATAWHLAYPHVPIESLMGRPTAELAGAISGWKGKLFEVEVEKRLNNGEWVGDLHLEPGQHAALAASSTQPGWDMQIFEDDGSVVDAIQLKATQSVSYVHHALERYPDTPILATHEVALRLADNSSIIDSGIHNTLLTESVSDHLADATSDAVSDSLMGGMPLSIIAITEATKVLSGKKTVDEALASGGDRLAKGVVAGTVAAAVSVVATPLVGAFAGFLTRLALDGETGGNLPSLTTKSLPDISNMRQTASKLRDYAANLEDYYPCPPRKKRPPPSSSLTNVQELLLYVDPSMRLSVLRGAVPLETWIKEMIAKDSSRMNEEDLIQHLADLTQIKARGVVDDAFPADGFLATVGRAFSSDYRELQNKLDDAIQTARIYQTNLGRPLTPENMEELQMLKLSPFERARAREQIRQKKRMEERKS